MKMKRLFVLNKNGRRPYLAHYHLVVKGKKLQIKFCLRGFLKVLGILQEDEFDDTPSFDRKASTPSAFTASLKEVTLKEAEKYEYYLDVYSGEIDIIRNTEFIDEDYTCFYYDTARTIRRLWGLPKNNIESRYYVFQVEYE